MPIFKKIISCCAPRIAVYLAYTTYSKHGNNREISTKKRKKKERKRIKEKQNKAKQSRIIIQQE